MAIRDVRNVLFSDRFTQAVWDDLSRTPGDWAHWINSARLVRQNTDFSKPSGEHLAAHALADEVQQWYYDARPGGLGVMVRLMDLAMGQVAWYLIARHLLAAEMELNNG